MGKSNAERIRSLNEMCDILRLRWQTAERRITALEERMQVTDVQVAPWSSDCRHKVLVEADEAGSYRCRECHVSMKVI